MDGLEVVETAAGSGASHERVRSKTKTGRRAALFLVGAQCVSLSGGFWDNGIKADTGSSYP